MTPQELLAPPPVQPWERSYVPLPPSSGIANAARLAGAFLGIGFSLGLIAMGRAFVGIMEANRPRAAWDGPKPDAWAEFWGFFVATSATGLVLLAWIGACVLIRSEDRATGSIRGG